MLLGILELWVLTVFIIFLKIIGYYFFKYPAPNLVQTPVTHMPCHLCCPTAHWYFFWSFVDLCVSFWVVFIPVSPGSRIFLSIVSDAVYSIKYTFHFRYFRCCISFLEVCLGLILHVPLPTSWCSCFPTFLIIWNTFYICLNVLSIHVLMLSVLFESLWDLFLLMDFLKCMSPIFLIFD